jgi:cyclopropane-fatty-acyl-phospholipid synthase
MHGNKTEQITESRKEYIQPVHPELRKWLEDTFRKSGLAIELSFNFWGKERLSCPGSEAVSRQLLVDVHTPGVIKELAASGDPLVLVEALAKGQLTATGTMDDLVAAFCYLAYKSVKASASLLEWCASLPQSVDLSAHEEGWTALPDGSPQRDKAVIHYTYDVSNDFYRLWLDPHMAYSCARFETEQTTLTQAQEAKFDIICRKLQLKPGERFLDIGCGWGALIRWAATKYGVKAHGITLSEEQYAHNRQWIEAEGLEDKITVQLLHYSDLQKEPVFDKISSVGMVEHVGIANYPTYFGNAIKALKPGGLFLNHGIVLNWIWQPEVAFVLRYIFPDSQCPPLVTSLQAAASAGWEIVDVDCWRPHYAKTLRCWADNLDKKLDEATAIVGDRIKIWQIYLILCAQGFENGSTSVYQTLLRKTADADWNLPMTRENWLA